MFSGFRVMTKCDVTRPHIFKMRIYSTFNEDIVFMLNDSFCYVTVKRQCPFKQVI